MTHYVWDDKKNALNIKKHEISFGEATEVFLDPLVFFAENPTSEKQERFRAYGCTLIQKALVVVFCAKSIFEGEEIIRIISARKLDRKEKKIMEGIRLGKSSKTVRRATSRHR